jgi:lysyl-tRNA synthetase class 2
MTVTRVFTGPPRAVSIARRDRGPRLAAQLARLAGVINLVSALLPAERARLRLLHDVVPAAVARGATVAVAAAGIGLLLLAWGLRRRQRVAWAVSVALLAGSAVLHVIKGLDIEEALLQAFLAGILVGQAGRFPARTGAGEYRAVLRPALAVVAVTVAYGVGGLLANDRDVLADLRPGAVLVQVGRMALGLGASVPLQGRFGRFFPLSVAVVGLTGLLLVALRALAPVLVRARSGPGLDRAVAASDDSLAYFALRDDRDAAGAGGAWVSYKPVGSVALAAGDPVGPPDRWPGAVTAFLATAARQGRTVAVLGCGAAAAAVYRAAGLACVYVGDEAVLDLDRFSLTGRDVAKARQSWNRARRQGWEAVVARSGDLDPDTVAALTEMSRRWREGRPERGYSMALGRLFDPRDPATVVVAGRGPDGRLAGFLHFVPWGADGASLDIMRRDRGGPGFLNDFLVVEAARRLPELGVRRVSLNFTVLRALLDDAGGGGRAARAGRWLLRLLSRRFQIEGLYRFNRKFAPAWQPRYLAVETFESIPGVVLAALRAEGLLRPPVPPALVPGPPLVRRLVSR